MANLQLAELSNLAITVSAVVVFTAGALVGAGLTFLIGRVPTIKSEPWRGTVNP